MATKGKKSLTDEEISVIKKLHADGKNNQVILGIINGKRGNPSLHINPGRVSEVLKNRKGNDIQAASEEELHAFMDKKVLENNSPISESALSQMLKIKEGTSNCLDIKESDTFECKENFNADAGTLVKPLVSFANNKGGYILYGVKDAIWEVVGLTKKKISDFEAWDLERLSGTLFDYAGCGLSVEKTTFNIAEKTIGVLYVHRATKRPIIMNKQNGEISTGQIYYRYPSMNRLIGSVELDAIIEDRVNSIISTTLSKHIQNIIKNGIENTAILNLKTGEVEGKSGNFVIDETLLPKIQFIKEGEFVETKGAPALKLMGDLHPITTVAEVEVEKEVEKSITIKGVIEAFVKQTVIAAPLEYIKTIALDNGKWMPIHYFIKKSKKNNEEIKEYLESLKKSEGKNYPQKTIEMMDSDKIPSFGRKSEKTKMTDIKAKTITEINGKEEALSFLASIGELSKGDLDLKYCLKILQQIIKEFWTDKEVQSKTKYCCAYLDQLFYKQ